MVREIGPVDDKKAVAFGNYRLTGKTLGKGAFAVVEEALHTQLRVTVSVKTINLSKCNAYVLKNLKREVDILRNLNHPNIVKFFEAIKHGNAYYMVTEIVRGGELRAYVHRQRKGQLDEKITRKFSRQIIGALEYIHKRGIVHRDLKLENILLDSTNEFIKIVDFGLSNYWTPVCGLQTRCGSPEYSAPELFVNEVKYGSEVDMWALGVIMYAMATGSLPFVYVSDIKKSTENRKNKFIERICQGLTEAQTRRITGYPIEFIRLLSGLMNPNRELRLSIGEVVNDPWISNNNHWTVALHGTLDAYDRVLIARQVCGQLEITADRLTAELRTKPYGEVAGFYNIMMFMNSQTAEKGIVDPLAKISTDIKKERVKKYKPQYAINNGFGSKVWVVGEPSKINDVTKIRRPLQRSIYTCSTTSSSSGNNTERSNMTAQTDVMAAVGDYVPSPHTDPSKPRVIHPPSKYPIMRNLDLGSVLSAPTKKDKKCNVTSPFSLLPSKFKLSYPSCKTK